MIDFAVFKDFASQQTIDDRSLLFLTFIGCLDRFFGFLGPVNRKLFLTIGLILAGLAGIYFFSGSLVQESVVIADADIIATNPDTYNHRELRVRGFVKPGSIIRTAHQASFIMEHNGKELPVFFTGNTQLPDTFTDSAPVRADGKLENGQLISTRIEAKCASKYEADYAEGKKHPSSISLDYKDYKPAN